MSDEEKKLHIKAGIKSRTIKVDYLARVEGEGALYIKTKGSQVEDVRLKIFEPPRFFEALLRGRSMGEAPDITARICGICPVAYQMSAVAAMENGVGLQVPEYLQQLRRLMYCGEWIESHTLHIIMLHAPDFLGYPDGIAMSKDHQEAVKRGLRLKKAGNEIIRLLGGREIHPINVKIGGFYSIPPMQKFKKLQEHLKQARDDAHEIVKWVSGFKFPHLERSNEYVSISHPNEYPMARGQIISSSGLKIEPKDYDAHFKETQAPYSNALQSTLNNRSYLAGPMARYNLNRQHLSPLVKQTIEEIGFEKTCVNPFRSIIVRALEVLYACDEALRILQEGMWEGQSASVEPEKRAAVGYGATEAPRGLLYHRYRIDADGVIEEAKIVPPTSQNQKSIEEDLRDFVSRNMALADQDLVWKCEQAIRNYDPCISCSTHFLKLERITN